MLSLNVATILRSKQSCNLFRFSLLWLFLLMLLTSVSYATPFKIDPSLLNKSNLPESYALIQLGNRVDAAKLRDVNKLLQQKKTDEVIQKAKKVIAKNPKSGLAYEVLGTALFMSGKQKKAITALEKTKKLEPKQSGAYTKLGIIYMESGKIKNAQKHFKKAIKINPNDRFAYQRLGLLYEYKKEYNKAIEFLYKGIEGTPPSYLGVAVNLANTLNQVKRYQDAIDVLAPRLISGSTVFEAYIILGTSYYETGQYTSAQKSFERAVKLKPDSAPAQLGNCMSLRKSGKFTESLALSKKLVKNRPDWLPAIVELGEIYLTVDRLQKAKEAFQKGVKLGGSNVAVQKRIAKYHLTKKEFNSAEKIYQQLIEAGNGDPDSYAKLSELYQAKGMHKKGIKLLRDGLKRTNGNSYLYFRLGAYLSSLKRYDEAIPELKHSLKKSPNAPNVLRTLCISQVKAGQNKGALQTADKLYSLFPESTSEAINYATRLQVSGQTNKAEVIYRQALSVHPKNVVILNNLAGILSNKGDFTEAEKLARRANSLSKGKNGNILDTLGWILCQKGSVSEAVSVLEAAVAATPDSATTLYHFGVALKKSGKSKVARENLTRAIKLAPDAKWVANARAQLKSLG